MKTMRMSFMMRICFITVQSSRSARHIFFSSDNFGYTCVLILRILFTHSHIILVWYGTCLCYCWISVFINIVKFKAELKLFQLFQIHKSSVQSNQFSVL